MYDRTFPYGPYKGQAVDSLPDDVFEALWRRLIRDNGCSQEEVLWEHLLEEECQLLDVIICVTVEHWNRTHDGSFSP